MIGMIIYCIGTVLIWIASIYAFYKFGYDKGWNDSIDNALDIVIDVCAKHGIDGIEKSDLTDET